MRRDRGEQHRAFAAGAQPALRGGAFASCPLVRYLNGRMTEPNQTAIVVGASAGIGAALSRRLAGEGRRVALVARRGAEVERLAQELRDAHGADRARGYAHDVSRFGEVEPLWQRIEAELGPVAELHYVAGSLLPMAPDEFDTDKDRQQFEVNTIGCCAWVNAAARRFQQRGSGRIVGVSSVAQDRGRIARPSYCASKAGMDTFLESVRNRLWRKGVQVTTIRPGFVDTQMIRGAKTFWVISADRAAELILRAVRARKAIAYVPARWRLMMAVIRSIPSFVFRKLNV